MKLEKLCAFPSMLLLLVLVGCTTTVNLSAINPSDVIQTAKVIVRDDPGSISGVELPLGDVAAKGGHVASTFKVKHGGTIELQGTYKGDVVFDSSQRYVSASPDPLDISYSLDMGGAHYLDDAKSLQNITEAFKKIGVPLMSEPESLTGAVNTIFGALLILDPGNDKIDPIIYTTITPAELGVKQVDLATALALVPDLHETSSVDITKNTATSLSVGFPLAVVGGSVSDANVYKLSWELSGYGYIQKPEDGDKSYINRYAALDDAHKKAIDDTLRAHPKAKLIYVNRLYVIKTATVSLTKGVKSSITGNVKAAIVTSDGAYSFEQSTSDARTISNIVLNFQGDELTPTIVNVPTPNADKATVAFLKRNPEVKFLVMPDEVEGIRSLKETGKQFILPVSMILDENQKHGLRY